MLQIIGGIIGFWAFYALIACFAKHKISLIIVGSIMIIAGISGGMVKGDYNTLIASIISIILIFLLPQFQVKS